MDGINQNSGINSTMGDDIALLMDDYSEDSKRLYKSFALAHMKVLPIVINDNGFLPQEITSVYGYFLGEFEGKPRYFNDIDVPDYWEISANNSSGKITDMGRERGRIFFTKPANKRIVRVVDWLDDKGIVRSSDHYNQYGAVYARTIFNSKGEKVSKTYFNNNGNEIISENFVTNDIILNYGNKTRIFRSKTDFILAFFIIAKLNQTRLFYNSLSTSFFVSQRLHSKTKNDILFWQEPVRPDIPGNMKIIFDGNASRTDTVVVQNRRAYRKLIELGAPSDKVKEIGFIYNFARENTGNKEILICTNSDRISHCQQLVEELKDFNFHIAAITEMSSKLMAMGKYDNVTLYPCAKDKIFEKLFDKCDYYLDINYESEIVDALTKAFLNNQMIFSFEDTTHNRTYTAAEHIFPSDNVDLMIKNIKECGDDGEARSTHLKLQHSEALVENEEAYHLLGLRVQKVRSNPQVSC